MTISVIIPTYNSAKHIKGCLQSLATQSLKPLEIIVVDDGSTDDTKKHLSECKVISQKHQGPAAARNNGAKKAKGDILVFVDSDMEFDKGFLKKLTEPIRKGKARGTFSKNEFVKNWQNPWAKAFSHCLRLKTNRLIPANYPNTAPVFRAILKTEFDRVKGFDTSLGYDDDWSLYLKLGYKAKVAPQAIYYHHNPETIISIFRQARWRASRRFRFGKFGKILVALKTFILFPFMPILLGLYYKSVHVFIVKPIFDLGTLFGIIKHSPKK